MAGAMRKAMVYLGLVEGQDRYDDDYVDERDYADERDYRDYRDRDGRDYRDEDARDVRDLEDRATREYRSRDRYERDYERPAERPEPEPVSVARADRLERSDRAATVASIADRRPSSAPARRSIAELARITTLHPRTYNDARTIGEYFRDNTPVIMNLTDMDDVDAKRLVDFAAGLVFGLRGAIDKITTKVFLLSPANVHVTAEEKARIAEGGFFNQS
jgi:cell division inhibitor SepF